MTDRHSRRQFLKTAGALVDSLPDDQSTAVRAYVLEDVGYATIAAAAQTTEATARKRVSRGLSTLRRRLGAQR